MDIAHRTAVIITIAVASLAAPAAAEAVTFCVHSPPGCVGTAQADLSSALTAAQGNGGNTKDTIQLGVGLFNDGPAIDLAGNQVDIVGVASNQTAITASGAGHTILKVLEPASTISHLRLHVTGTGIETGVELAGHASDVVVTNSGTANAIDGVKTNGATAIFDDGGVDLTYNNNTTRAIFGTQGSTATVTDSFLSATVGVDASGGDVTVRRSSVHAHQGMIVTAGSHGTVSDTSFRAPGPGTANLSSFALFAGGTGTSVLDADRVTAYGNGTANYGLWVGPNDGAGNDATINLQGSVVDGFGQPIRATEAGGSNSTVNTSWSAYNLGAENIGAGVTYTHAPNDFDIGAVSPRFVDAANGVFNLRHDSPLIDRGDPAFQPFIGLDRDSHIRVRDGDGNSSGVVDMGALEYQRRAPVAVASAAPSPAAPGQAIAFNGSASHDPDIGDALSYAWTFDDGATANGATVQHAFATPGPHTATLTVTDPVGLTNAAQTSVMVVMPPPAGGGSSGPGPSPFVPTPPKLTQLRIVPAWFRAAGRRSTRTRSAARVPIGTTVRYTLSTSATVTFAVQRPAAGRRVGRTCRRPTRANRRRPRCTRWLTVGTITQRGAAGANARRFDGRLRRRALALGRYRLLVRARQGTGPASAPLTAGFRIVG